MDFSSRKTSRHTQVALWHLASVSLFCIRHFAANEHVILGNRFKKLLQDSVVGFRSLSSCLSEVARSLRDLKGTIASTDEPGELSCTVVLEKILGSELRRMTRHFADIVVPVVADMYSKIYGDVAQHYLPLISTEVSWPEFSGVFISQCL